MCCYSEVSLETLPFYKWYLVRKLSYSDCILTVHSSHKYGTIVKKFESFLGRVHFLKASQSVCLPQLLFVPLEPSSLIWSSPITLQRKKSKRISKKKRRQRILSKFWNGWFAIFFNNCWVHVPHFFQNWVGGWVGGWVGCHHQFNLLTFWDGCFFSISNF